MSRSGYSDDCDNIELYRATVDRTLKGKRGQAFLREMAAALDAMPVKELIQGELIAADGGCCAIGAVCKARTMDVSGVDYYDPESVGNAVGISRSMAAEIEYMNDERVARWELRSEMPAERWTRMRKWVAENIVAETPNE